MLTFSFRNLLLVISLAAFWLGLILHDDDYRIRKQAIQIQKDWELIHSLQNLDRPIMDQEIQRSLEKLSKGRRPDFTKR